MSTTTKKVIVPTESYPAAQWAILPNSTAEKRVESGVTHRYDLFNLVVAEAVVYGHRSGNNINLVWGDPGKSDNIFFTRMPGKTGPILFGEPVAIHFRGGKYVKYQSGRWGINLGWSDTPVFEWRIEGGTAGTPVPTMSFVSIFNMVTKDCLVYKPREYGINLQWRNDAIKGTYPAHGYLTYLETVAGLILNPWDPKNLKRLEKYV